MIPHSLSVVTSIPFPLKPSILGVDRPACLAALLLRQGLVDTFRARHPTLQAFTYYARSGAASRLDAVWWLPSPSHEVLVLNAATIWQWDRRADHDPVVSDLSVVLPDIPPTADPPRRGVNMYADWTATSPRASTPTLSNINPP